MRTVFSIGALLFALSFQFTFAQSQLGNIVNPQMTIELEPSYPTPGQEVTATINDYGGGTYGSTITWVFNGQEILEAQNRRSAIVQTGDIDEVDQLQVILTRPNGTQEVLSKTIEPVYIDIILEPQTRVPDFYLGRSLPSIGSLVNATALVNNGSFQEDLVYTWNVNRKVIEAGPLRGRNKVSFEMPRGDSAVLSLQATRPNGEVLGIKSIRIPSVRPDLLFYETSSLLGISNVPIRDSLNLIGSTATLRAEPYNLDSRVYNNPNIAEWEINGQPSSANGGNPYEITLQRTGTAGSINLGFHVRDTQQVLQGVEEDIRVAF